FGEEESTRCDTEAQLIARGCKMEEIISPRNIVTTVKKGPLSESFSKQESVQLNPQETSLILRRNLPATLSVSFKRVQGYPVDLYFLLDLSYSMTDDLENAKQLGQDLFAALSKITEHAQIGLGVFVDKTVLPYTNTHQRKLQKPRDENDQQCQAAFGYRHVLSMTPEKDEFKAKVREQVISGNLTSPDEILDAMMQAAVCGDKIGWRNGSTWLIVLTTYAGFHIAGDGNLASKLEPNDELCHLENNLYTKSTEMDYPSVGQLAMQLEKNNIQPIFAVKKNVENVNKSTSTLIPKSEVGVLSSDSKNVVELMGSVCSCSLQCNDSYSGQFCECYTDGKDERSLRASCQRQNGSECEGRGDCVWQTVQNHAASHLFIEGEREEMNWKR
ncbi:integrin beta-2-like, partial [Micropterus salmoides]|uniref:integrin beta-2-like n=1 Tax=Micropterus salmoides TaxID=27706 RepID=UPI0018EC91FF